MALVLMATHGWGTLFVDPADLEAGVGLQSSFTNPADATAVTHYADDVGSSPSTGPVTADANGRLMRWVEEGTYNQTLPGGTVLPVEAVSGSTFAAVETSVATATSDIALLRAITRYNVKDFPYLAPGDGTSHPLSTRFATLGAAQAIFPAAVALTDEIDWAAHQTVFNLTKAVPYGGALETPEGSYLFNRALDVGGCTGVTWVGAGKPDSTSTFWATKIYMSGTDDLLTGVGVHSIRIQDLLLRSGPTGGHVQNMTGTWETSTLENVQFHQENPAKSCVNWAGTTPVIEVDWDKCTFTHRSDATVPTFSANGTGGLFNFNQIRRSRFTFSGEYAIHIEATGGSSYATDNSLEDVNFETCNGGCVKLKAAVRTYLKNCVAYDLHIAGNPPAYQPALTPTQRDLFWIGKNSSSLKSRKTTLVNCGRAGGTLGAAPLYDIKFETAGSVGTVMINCGDPITDYAVDFGSCPVVVLGSEDVAWAAKANAGSVRWVDRADVRMLVERIARADALSAGTRYIGLSGALVAGGNVGAGVFYFDPADHGAAIALKIVAVVNATAPATDFTYGLYPVTAGVGGAAVVGVTAGAVIAASQITLTAPAAGSVNHAEVSFTPPAAGYYIIGLVTPGAMAASSSLQSIASVETR